MAAPTPRERLDAIATGFIEAMFAAGAANATAVIDRLDLTGVTTVADLGGGPGHYLVEIGRRLPSADLYLLDLPLSLESAREFLRRQPGESGSGPSPGISTMRPRRRVCRPSTWCSSPRWCTRSPRSATAPCCAPCDP